MAKNSKKNYVLLALKEYWDWRNVDIMLFLSLAIMLLFVAFSYWIDIIAYTNIKLFSVLACIVSIMISLCIEFVLCIDAYGIDQEDDECENCKND